MMRPPHAAPARVRGRTMVRPAGGIGQSPVSPTRHAGATNTRRVRRMAAAALRPPAFVPLGRRGASADAPPPARCAGAGSGAHHGAPLRRRHRTISGFSDTLRRGNEHTPGSPHGRGSAQATSLRASGGGGHHGRPRRGAGRGGAPWCAPTPRTISGFSDTPRRGNEHTPGSPHGRGSTQATSLRASGVGAHHDAPPGTLRRRGFGGAPWCAPTPEASDNLRFLRHATPGQRTHAGFAAWPRQRSGHQPSCLRRRGAS